MTKTAGNCSPGDAARLFFLSVGSANLIGILDYWTCSTKLKPEPEHGTRARSC